MNTRPIVWTVAGSDSGGGAGIQADLRAFDAMDVHGCSAIAALTAQNSVSVTRIAPVAADLLDAQLAALAADMPPAAIKTGMLGSVENLQVLVRWIDVLRAANPALAVVVDPVLGATTGRAFADADLLQAMRTQLLPRATLITPNRREAAALLGLPALRERTDVEDAARALVQAGSASVIITGGDVASSDCEDFAITPQAAAWLRNSRVATPHHHGTGCVFASSAAAAMAHGFVAMEALVIAKMATTHGLRHACAAGAGAGPVRPRADFGQHIGNLPALVPAAQHLPVHPRGPMDAPDTAPPKGHGADHLAHAFAPLHDPDLGLYAIVDTADWVRRVLDAGVRTVQLRVKHPQQSGLRQQVRASVAAARAVGAQLFINDHWQVAIDEGAYGVHLGQEDLATADLAQIAEAGLRLGISTHAFWEVCRAWALRPSYIACGPIHPTQAKAMPWIPQGNDNLAYWCRLLPLPVVAIAGMDVPRTRQAAASGAAGVAVISAITAAQNPEQAISALTSAWALGRREATVPLPPLLPRPSL
jgi:hydroxymethylpyrimidine kinase / phosphomethylpyrimidine kinase / thiamine-phosphate diphosphorylase